MRILSWTEDTTLGNNAMGIRTIVTFIRLGAHNVEFSVFEVG